VTSFFAPKLKIALKGRRFNDATMIKAELQITFAQFKTVEAQKGLNVGVITGLV
jgi:hypothetical protein